MTISILTLFPQMFLGPFDHSIIKIARQKELVEINIVNIRDFGIGKHRIVDDKPYGGGHGMILRVDVVHNAILHALSKKPSKKTRIVLLDARGNKFTQKKAVKLAKIDHLVLVAGHYEGVDERITAFTDEVISIGDYVLTGGEIPAMVITDAVVRLVPSVLKKEVTRAESFSEKNKISLEYPQFTRPQNYKNLSVPKVLILGNHKKSIEWKNKQSLTITRKRRPDLIK